MPRHDYFTISSPGAPPQPVICGTMQVGIRRMMIVMMIVMLMIVIMMMIVMMIVMMMIVMMMMMIQSGTHLYVEMEGREGLGCAQLSITQVDNFIFLHFGNFSILCPKIASQFTI